MKGKKKSKMGRPPIPERKRRSAIVAVRLTRGERARLGREARRRGMTITEVLLEHWREGRK